MCLSTVSPVCLGTNGSLCSCNFCMFCFSFDLESSCVCGVYTDKLIGVLSNFSIDQRFYGTLGDIVSMRNRLEESAASSVLGPDQSGRIAISPEITALLERANLAHVEITDQRKEMGKCDSELVTVSIASYFAALVKTLSRHYLAII